MAFLIGGIIGFYIVYAICAAIFKHKAGLTIAGVLCVLAGIANVATSQSVAMLLSSVAGVIIVALVKPLQIRKDTEKDNNDSHADE